MRFTFYGFQNTLENCLTQHMRQTQSSMGTHHQSYGSENNEHSKVLLSASADEPLETHGDNEAEEPKETRLNLYTNDLPNVRKSDCDQRGRGRKVFRSSRSRSIRSFGSRGGENSRPNRNRDLSGSNMGQARENFPCLGWNSTDHVIADHWLKPEYSKIRANLLRKGLNVPSAAALTVSIMNTHYKQMDMCYKEMNMTY